MKKIGTTLLLALSLLSLTTACGKKDNANNSTAYNQCYNNGYGYNNGYSTNCGYGGQYGNPYGNQYGQQCQAGYVPTQLGCLPQGSCPAGYGYHPQGYQGMPGCIPVSQYGAGNGYYGNGYNQQYQQPYNPYGF